MFLNGRGSAAADPWSNAWSNACFFALTTKKGCLSGTGGRESVQIGVMDRFLCRLCRVEIDLGQGGTQQHGTLRRRGMP